MEDTWELRSVGTAPTQLAAQPINHDSSGIIDLDNIASTVSRRNQAIVPLIFFPIGLMTVGACIASIGWLAMHGPALVPGQDSRITAIIISIGTRLASLFIGVAITRSAWGSYVKRVLAEDTLPTRQLVGACRPFMSFGQITSYMALPSCYKYYIILAALVALAMTGTSASFRYDSRGLVGSNSAIVPDVGFYCNKSQVSSSNYDCSGELNANTTGYSWSYLDQVNGGGQGLVSRTGELGYQELEANVTLAVLPQGWSLNNGNNLPWMAIGVSCQPLPIAARFYGSNISAAASIYVNDSLSPIDTLDIANMPEWQSIVRLYKQYNETSHAASNLAPWVIVFLEVGGPSNSTSGPLAPDTLTYLGVTYVDLWGYGPIPQQISGAAALCQFRGSTGGRWPDDERPWPLLNTSNLVLGTMINGRPTMGTVLLNYGPSWQYNPVSGGAIPSGSVIFIANNTGPGVSFPVLISAYIRNQWALMAYSIAPLSGHQVTQSFMGSGPNKLFISLTLVAVLPASALVLGLLLILNAWICSIRNRRWVNRIEFDSWWLVKALRPDLYSRGYSNATEKDFNNGCENFFAGYRDLRPNNEVGHLVLCSATRNEVPMGAAISINARRVYG